MASIKKVYRIEMMVCATAYIKARSPADAYRKALKLKQESPNILDHEGGLPVCGLQFTDPNLPSISLSPAMTIHDVWPDAHAERADS